MREPCSCPRPPFPEPRDEQGINATPHRSRVEQADGRDFLVLDIGLPDAHGLGYGGCDLHAALAALIRPEGA